MAARGIQECLLLQLTADPDPDPVSVEIVERYFDELGRRRYADIARAMKLSLDRIMESIDEIQALEPKPGRQFAVVDSRYIVPDVTIQKVGADYVVVLNEEGIPRLRVNALYRSLLRRSGDEAKQYVEQKIRSAVWLIKSVEQRQRTLRRVAQSLVNFQREFLDKGLPFLRPLALRDVGDDINMHESTISRVTTNKYVQTPQGLFELKYFFHSGIVSVNGSMVSSVSVKQMIKDMVEAEDVAAALSDQEIAQALHGRGLTIARRTVAKYREELAILPSHQRRLQARSASRERTARRAGGGMQAIISARGLSISKTYKDTLTQRLAKLEPMFPGIVEAKIVLSKEKHRRTAALTLVAKRHTFRSEETAADLETAVDVAVDALARQVREMKDRVKNRKARSAPRRAPAPARAAGSPTAEVAVMRVPLELMPLAAAVEQLRASRDEFLVFTNATTDVVSVLYRRGTAASD